jgi:hypothetical protein
MQPPGHPFYSILTVVEENRVPEANQLGKYQGRWYESRRTFWVLGL